MKRNSSCEWSDCERRSAAVPRDLPLDGLSPADLAKLRIGDFNMERRMPSEIPSMQEAIRIFMWGGIGWMIANGWITEGMGPAMMTFGLAGLAMLWRYLAGNANFPNVT
jgi:hypothetical protein